LGAKKNDLERKNFRKKRAKIQGKFFKAFKTLKINGL
jgi:hypothetical protein